MSINIVSQTKAVKAIIHPDYTKFMKTLIKNKNKYLL